MPEKNGFLLDENTRKVKKFTIWGVAFLLFCTLSGVVFKGIVTAAEKVLFVYSLPANVKAMNTRTKLILDIVCEFHKSSKCPNQ